MSVVAALEATWPAASGRAVGAFRIRDGAGGGKRVSAALPIGPAGHEEVNAAEAAMRAAGQRPLVRIRSGVDDAIDEILADRGYHRIDPTTLLTAPAGLVAGDGPDPVTAFPVWPPLQVMEEIWAAGGVGPERVAVMQRCAGRKTSILGRTKDSPAGCAFVAIHERIAMIHALDVAPEARRSGVARNMLRAAATWAVAQGADTMATATVAENAPAQELFSSLGFRVLERYHYRQAPNGDI